ncbi:GTP-binding A [Paramuricea clavata]|uniref:GTP-binding A n=1 Tax=Paramuricea clavata TaxID=317549 RepID=A0A6S7JE01_PARCT|nr:GTP-binding A [Paramuricea clavata]
MVYHVNKDLCEDVKNVVIAYAKSNVDKHVQSSRSEKKLPSTSSFEIDVDSATHSTSPQEESIMKPLPRDERALFQEAYSLGLIGQNPDLPRAKLIDHIKSSKMIGRSINHVSILLVGLSGVGKSATINHLLRTKDEIAKTSYFETGTRSTQEFIVYGSAPRYEVEGLPLGVVDTPGFGDTDGLYQDACNFFSIQEFFHTHPKLTGHYPNLIFVIVKANDNRFSEFVKWLEHIKLQNLVDRNNPNVVAVITHVCKIPNRKVDKWSKIMETKKTTVKRIIFDALKVTAPVVLLENMYGKEGYDLDVVGDYTRLPNGVLQPKNLYEACADVLKNNNDNLGLITLNSIFAPSTKVPPPKRGHKIEAKNVKSQL